MSSSKLISIVTIALDSCYLNLSLNVMNVEFVLWFQHTGLVACCIILSELVTFLEHGQPFYNNNV